MLDLETLEERSRTSRKKFRQLYSRWLNKERHHITIEANAYSYQVTFNGEPWCESADLSLILNVFTRYVESYDRLYNSDGLTPVVEC